MAQRWRAPTIALSCCVFLHVKRRHTERMQVIFSCTCARLIGEKLIGDSSKCNRLTISYKLRFSIQWAYLHVGCNKPAMWLCSHPVRTLLPVRALLCRSGG